MNTVNVLKEHIAYNSDITIFVYLIEWIFKTIKPKRYYCLYSSTSFSPEGIYSILDKKYGFQLKDNLLTKTNAEKRFELILETEKDVKFKTIEFI